MEAEKLVIKVIRNDEEIAEIDMSDPERGPIYKDEIRWFKMGRLRIGNCYPYNYMVSLDRFGTKEEIAQLEKEGR